MTTQDEDPAANLAGLRAALAKKSAELEGLTRERDEAKSALQKLQQLYDKEMTQKESELAPSQQRLQTTSTQADPKSRKRNHTAFSSDPAATNPQDKLRQSESQIKDLQSELEKRGVKCEEIRKRWQVALEELEDHYQLCQQKSSDDTYEAYYGDIDSKWKGLRYKVRNMISNHISPAVATDIEPGWADELKCLTANFRKYLANKPLNFEKENKSSHYLFEAYIWHVLYREIFMKTGRVWEDKVGQDFSSLTKSIQERIERAGDSVDTPKRYQRAEDSVDPLKRYHTWRAQTAGIIDRHCKRDTGAALLVAKDLGNKFLSAGLIRNEEYFQDNVTDLATQALDIARLLALSTSGFRVSPVVNHGQQIADDRISVDTIIVQGQMTNGEVVDLVLVPGLFVRGHPDGEGYDKEEVFNEAEVITRGIR